MKKKFVVGSSGTDEAFGLAMEFIHERLGTLGLNTRDIIRAELMCEESLVRLLKYSDFTQHNAFQVNVRKLFGDVLITIAVPGSNFDFTGSMDAPFADDGNGEDDILPDTAEALQNLILRPFADNLRYKHSGSFNIITVKAFRSDYAGLYKTLTALFLAAAAGFLMRAFVPESTYISMNDNIFTPVRTIFMNALKMCAVPVIFCSILSCISEAGNLSDLKRAGSSLIKSFIGLQSVAVIVGFCLVNVFGTGQGVNLAVTSAQATQNYAFSMKDTLMNLIPENIVTPFLSANMLQLIIIAAFIGAAISITGVKILRSTFTEINIVFMKITEIFVKFIPLVMFCSIASMVLTAGTDTLLSLLGLLFTILAGYALMNIVFGLMVKFLTGLSPVTMFRKSMPLITTAFSTSSSAASIPEGLKSCEAMGIAQKLYSFSIPLGTSLHKTGYPLYYAVTVLAAANMYGIHMALADMLSLAFSIVVMSLATPGLPGAGLITLSILLIQSGCPVEFVSIVLGIEAIHDLFNTVTNCMGNIACTLVTAHKENMLDTKKYNRG